MVAWCYWGLNAFMGFTFRRSNEWVLCESNSFYILFRSFKTLQLIVSWSEDHVHAVLACRVIFLSPAFPKKSEGT